MLGVMQCERRAPAGRGGVLAGRGGAGGGLGKAKARARLHLPLEWRDLEPSAPLAGWEVRETIA